MKEYGDVIHATYYKSEVRPLERVICDCCGKVIKAETTPSKANQYFNVGSTLISPETSKKHVCLYCLDNYYLSKDSTTLAFFNKEFALVKDGRTEEIPCDKTPSSLKEYEDAMMRTANPSLTMMEQLEDALMGLNGEAGECIDILKKHLFQDHNLNKEHLAKELGDVAWYLVLAARSLGYNLDTIFQMNIDKLASRYPNGFESDKSINRKTGDI